MDFILSHDCPLGIGVPNTPGFEFYGEPGFPRSRELVEHFSPKKWFFGHHHRWFSKKIENSFFLGLPESWKGFGILDENGDYQTYINCIEKKESWFRAFLKKWFQQY